MRKISLDDISLYVGVCDENYPPLHLFEKGGTTWCALRDVFSLCEIDGASAFAHMVETKLSDDLKYIVVDDKTETLYVPFFAAFSMCACMLPLDTVAYLCETFLPGRLHVRPKINRKQVRMSDKLEECVGEVPPTRDIGFLLSQSGISRKQRAQMLSKLHKEAMMIYGIEPFGIYEEDEENDKVSNPLNYFKWIPSDIRPRRS